MSIQSADDLRTRIRYLAADEPNPAVITDQILRTLTAPEFRVVATVALHEFVRRAMTQAVAPAVQTYETANGARTASPKVAAIRDWVDRRLAASVCVNESAHEWKFLRECTAADLAATADMRRRKAAANVAEAEYFDGIHKAVEHAGVDTVGELPRDTLEMVLKR